MKTDERGVETPSPSSATLLFIFGTRPEAIKLAPIIGFLRRKRAHYHVRVCVTAQHRELLDQVLKVFDIRPDYDLDLMSPGQTLFQSTARILSGLEPVLAEAAPDMVFVQGDTTTTFTAALAAFYARVPVAHVEAGLRTGNAGEPFPEEVNRVLTSRLSALHFAPTEGARQALLREQICSNKVKVTGNTGIDALLYVKSGLETGLIQSPQLPDIDPGRKLLLVTTHRRESFGEGLRQICSALFYLSSRADVQIVLPVHPNPNVRAPLYEALGGAPNVYLVDPLSYVAFIGIMNRAHVLITDSGGVQEEGPSLGKPVLVLRNTTERPEAIEAGTALLVGTDRDRIVAETERLLDDVQEYKRRTLVHNPYGDGRASERIADILDGYFGK